MTGWNDIERSLITFDEVRRRMEQLWDDADGAQRPTPMGTHWPRLNLMDRGDSVVVMVEVPGIDERAVSVQVNNDLLTIEGDRRNRAPDGYVPYRQERPSLKFARAVVLPCKVDLERTTATASEGVLTITLPKAPEARPRQIAVTPA